MNKLIVRVHNIETNEIIDREMNKIEIEAWQADQAAQAAKQAEEQAKLVKRAEILSRLGITEEEARILLG